MLTNNTSPNNCINISNVLVAKFEFRFCITLVLNLLNYNIKTKTRHLNAISNVVVVVGSIKFQQNEIFL